MKILHWAIILVIIVLPTSLICRINVNAKFSALKDEVRINNAIDTATKDAIDQVIAVNESMIFDGSNSVFSDIIDITPALANEMVNTFFHTMAVNYNIPYQEKDFSSNSEDSYIKNYFSSYIPAVVVVAYDGFYIYSLENSGSGYKYQMSSKIPYTYYRQVGQYNFSIGYTLGKDIYFYYDRNGQNAKWYSGRLTDNSLEETIKKYEEYCSIYPSGTTPTQMVNIISSISNDMSLILYALRRARGTY